MATIDDVRQMVAGDNGLATIAVTRDDGTVHASVVNVGVIDHPLAGGPVVATVLRGDTHKLRLIRQRSRASVTIRSGWQWAGVEGPTTVIGPDDEFAEMDGDTVRLLLREIFQAAGGTHDDYDEYDRVMAEERRTAVLIAPERILGR